jgi:hypothetical protein
VTDSAAFDVAIGLVFAYFIFSSVCSGINEGIARILNLRGVALFNSINALIGDVEKSKAFWSHDLITGLLKTRSTGNTAQKAIQGLGGKITKDAEGVIGSTIGLSLKLRRALPSYISPTTVITVMKAVSAPVPEPAPGAASPAATGFESIFNSVKNAVESEEKQVQDQLENWFNDAMDRLSGWYKRFVQWILLVLAILVTLAFNVNTIHIAQELWQQPSISSAIAVDSNSIVATGATGETASTVQDLKSRVTQAEVLPIGWGSNAPGNGWDNISLAVLGWLLTIGALTFGSPFWFDLLCRMNSLRSTGPPATT